MMPWVPTGANGMRGVPYTHTPPPKIHIHTHKNNMPAQSHTHPQNTQPYTYRQHAHTITHTPPRYTSIHIQTTCLHNLTHTPKIHVHTHTYKQHACTISQAKKNRDTEPSGAEDTDMKLFGVISDTEQFQYHSLLGLSVEKSSARGKVVDKT